MQQPLFSALVGQYQPVARREPRTRKGQRLLWSFPICFYLQLGKKKKCNVAHERPITEKYIQFKLTRTLHNLQRKRFIITLHTRAFGSVTAAWIVRGLLASKERLSSRKTASATPTVETPFEIGRNAAEQGTVCSLVSGSWAASADRPGTQVHRWISGVQFQLF